MINSFKNNDQKMKYLLDIWYSETFDDAYIGKMNLDKNDVIEMSKAGRLSDYQEEAKKKQTEKRKIGGNDNEQNNESHSLRPFGGAALHRAACLRKDAR